VIWRGGANSIALRSFALCQSPPVVLNVTGQERLPSVDRPKIWRTPGVEPVIEVPNRNRAVSNAARCHKLSATHRLRSSR
jgi:hypothetical protein